MDGMTYSVESPNITRGHKSTLLFGLHEMEERHLVKAWLPRRFPVIELGGGLGVVSCLANRIIDDPERHMVVEANPLMIPVLERNRSLNDSKFEVINRAIDYGRETTLLPIDPAFVGSNLAAVGEVSDTVEVRTATVEEIADGAGFEQFSLIADIEGVEEQVILKEIPKLGERLRFAMFEMHPCILGGEIVGHLMDVMKQNGFRLLERRGDERVFCVAYSRD
jgi:FkbM family methyltransferase